MTVQYYINCDTKYAVTRTLLSQISDSTHHILAFDERVATSRTVNHARQEFNERPLQHLRKTICLSVNWLSIKLHKHNSSSSMDRCHKEKTTVDSQQLLPTCHRLVGLNSCKKLIHWLHEKNKNKIWSD